MIVSTEKVWHFWQKRMAPWKEKMDEFSKNFDKHFH